MRVRTFVLVVSGLCLVAFVLLFALPIHAGTLACGNGWTIDPGNVPACDHARAVRKAIGVFVLGLGIVGFFGVFLAWHARPRPRNTA
ncbi:hypothetical protein FPZ12_021445 [Amycolatopsis acidicola]|uniref:Uncharacterized protein n=1 Tax=Amycolatopsis acidicola TaxID=2596893 RepID=A0A5N0V2V2_9PSEU|nr:hypothetical protein [Amycolatopsis acidicola]KAA9158874.1 hypothetical protein FPZ12_021445 [Amycolatopsis acidicola]